MRRHPCLSRRLSFLPRTPLPRVNYLLKFCQAALNLFSERNWDRRFTVAFRVIWLLWLQAIELIHLRRSAEMSVFCWQNALTFNRMTDMKSSWKALLIVIVGAAALLVGGYASQPPAPPTTFDNGSDCFVDEQSDCTERCITEHNCCVKSCNWVESKAKSKCLKYCKANLEYCYQKCDEDSEAD